MSTNETDITITNDGEEPLVQMIPEAANEIPKVVVETISFRETWLDLGISETTLCRLVDEGKLTAIKDETQSKMHWRFIADEVRALKDAF